MEEVVRKKTCTVVFSTSTHNYILVQIPYVLIYIDYIYIIKRKKLNNNNKKSCNMRDKNAC